MAAKNEYYFKFLENAVKMQEEGLKTWKKLCEEYKDAFDEELSESALRHRAQWAVGKSRNGNLEKDTPKDSNSPVEFTEYSYDGTIEACKIVNSIKEFNGDKSKVLSLLGYSDKDWELLKVRTSIWDGGANGEQRYSVKYKVRPISSVPTSDFVSAVVNAIKQEVEPIDLPPKKESISLREETLMEIPPVELHLGKIASKLTTGEEYDINIAENRFYSIFEEVFRKQENERCQTCLLVIGSDFFNSEFNNATSTNKIPQQNCAHYIDIFSAGVRMYQRVILQLREMFNDVYVMLCAGNHARAMEFFLYVALQQAYLNDDVVHFSNNYQETQAFEFGENVIFYNHGDADIKRLIRSIPAEFSKAWGEHRNRELHLGHLHKEVVVDDESGMITRRVGSPCATDVWHKLNRYVGNTKKHQVFVWNAYSGLSDIFYIPISDN